MANMIKCSTGGIENKIIKRQELKPLEASQELINKLKTYEYFQYPMNNFKVLFDNEAERNDFYLGYFRENNNNIDNLINQPANSNFKIATFTSKKVLEIYKKNNSDN